MTEDYEAGRKRALAIKDALDIDAVWVEAAELNHEWIFKEQDDLDYLNGMYAVWRENTQKHA